MVMVERSGAEPFHLREERVHVDDRPAAAVLELGQVAHAADVQKQIGRAETFAQLIPGCTVDFAGVAVDIDDGDSGVVGRDEVSNEPEARGGVVDPVTRFVVVA